MTPKNPDRRCQAVTKSGKRCAAAATEGGFCYFHANPNKARELGRIGGRSKVRPVGESPDPLPVLDNVFAVRDAVARLINDVLAGRLAPKIAAGVTPLLQLQLRVLEAIDAAELHQRLEKIEKAQAKMDGKRTSEQKPKTLQAPISGPLPKQ
jgi:Family of unknown function (DUF5763)